MISFIKIIMFYYYIFHVLSCIFIFIGLYQNKEELTNINDIAYNGTGWMIQLDIKNNESQFKEVYYNSLYYVIGTFSTCGYGDLLSLTIAEFLFTILLIMVGQMLYSFFLGSLRAIYSHNQLKTKEQVMREKSERIELFFLQISKKGVKNISAQQISEAIQTLQISEQFNIKKFTKESSF